MLRKILDISSEGLFLHHNRGFLTIKQNDQILNNIPLDDISVLILSAHLITLTKDIMAELIQRGSVIILCSNKFSPISIITPLFGNYLMTEKLITQINASLPLKKRIWQSIIKEKIKNQAVFLKIRGFENKSKLLIQTSTDVLSGDSTNREAYAAKEYWEVIINEKFTRRHDKNDAVNSYLNYGYTVLRGMVARAICSAGLHPSLGIFHHNKLDNMCLTDDLMEPFRIIIDMMAFDFYQKHSEQEEMIEWKKTVIKNLPDYKVRIKGQITKLSIALDIYANSLFLSFKAKENQICIPEIFLTQS